MLQCKDVECKTNFVYRNDSSHCKSELQLIQGHWKWHHSKYWLPHGFLFAFHSIHMAPVVPVRLLLSPLHVISWPYDDIVSASYGRWALAVTGLTNSTLCQMINNDIPQSAQQPSDLQFLTTSQPSYLNNLISVQPPRSTRSSSVVALLAHQPSPHWKSQIAHSICITPSLGSTPWFFPSASPVMSRLASSFTCQPILVIISTLSIHDYRYFSLLLQNHCTCWYWLGPA